MAGIADLVLTASRNKGGRLYDVPIEITEGGDYKWRLEDIVDATGAAIDFTAATIVCKVIATITGAATDDPPVFTVTGTGGSGFIEWTVSAATTANKATGAGRDRPRYCWWYCTVTLSGVTVYFWGPSGSPFNIYAAG